MGVGGVETCGRTWRTFVVGPHRGRSSKKQGDLAGRGDNVLFCVFHLGGQVTCRDHGGTTVSVHTPTPPKHITGVPPSPKTTKNGLTSSDSLFCPMSSMTMILRALPLSSELRLSSMDLLFCAGG